MSIDTPTLSYTADPVLGRLTLTNVEKANALSPEAVADWNSTLSAIEEEPPAGVIVESAGRTFCGGFDLSGASKEDGELREQFVAIQALLERVRALSTTTVAVVRGPAIGAGADLVAACDIRIGTDGSRFRFPGPRFGLLLGTQRLREVVGDTGFIELGLGMRMVETHEAYTYGLLTHHLPDEQIAEWISEFASTLELKSAYVNEVQRRLLRGEALGPAEQLVRRSLAEPNLGERIFNYQNPKNQRKEIK